MLAAREFGNDDPDWRLQFPVIANRATILWVFGRDDGTVRSYALDVGFQAPRGRAFATSIAR